MAGQAIKSDRFPIRSVDHFMQGAAAGHLREEPTVFLFTFTQQGDRLFLLGKIENAADDPPGLYLFARDNCLDEHHIPFAAIRAPQLQLNGLPRTIW